MPNPLLLLLRTCIFLVYIMGILSSKSSTSKKRYQRAALQRVLVAQHKLTFSNVAVFRRPRPMPRSPT